MSVVNVCAPDWTPQESYSRIARALTKGLRAMGYTVNTLGHKAPIRTITPAFGGILLAYPTNFHQWGVMPVVGPKVAVTMFESTQLPDGWAEVLNTCASVIVPSQFLERVFRNAGVTSRIVVAPLGINSAFKFAPRDWSSRPRTFLTIGDRGKRKGWHIAAFAFQKAFGDDMNYRLLIKCRPGSLRFRVSNPNIHLIEGDYSDRKLAALYQEAHFMLFPTAGEGFGLPPREFAATGGISLATAWGGTEDHIDRWGVPIHGFITDTAWKGEGDFEGLGLWAEVNPDHLAEKLQAIASLDSDWSQKAVLSSVAARRLYTWKNFVRVVEEEWRAACDGNTDAA
jgi:glycosyltransferase involved in cell wall biosynthesis